MSKENVIDFLKQATEDESLKNQVQAADDQGELVELAKEHGYEFSKESIKEAIPVIQQEKGFFGDLVEAILELFGPTHDDYPNTGVQPFSGEPNRR